MTTIIDHAARGHSPLGASGAERWMECPGSVSLLRELKLTEEDDPLYRREGTALHEAAEYCLTNHADGWEIVGQTFNEVEIDVAMANAVQVYLDKCRTDVKQMSWHQIEYPISSPVHPAFYGTADFTGLTLYADPRCVISELREGDAELVVRDLKGGEGIIVEPEENPQMKYYAFGVIDGWERASGQRFADELPVRLSIVQPRAYHDDGPIREWVTTVGAIREWVHDTLVPAMCRAEYDHTLDAGPWCRFCPAKLVCPMLTSLFQAACTANPKEVINYNDASIARSYQYVQAVKFYLKALEEETFRRLNKGITMPGSAKLVAKKANRVFKDGAMAEALKRFKDEAMNPPEFKSPAQLEKTGQMAKEFVKEWSYLPEVGYTVATWDDPRKAVVIKSSAETFGSAIANLEKSDAA